MAASYRDFAAGFPEFVQIMGKIGLQICNKKLRNLIFQRGLYNFEVIRLTI